VRWAFAGFAALVMGCRPASPFADTITVARDALVVTVDTSGTLRAVDSVRLGPPHIADVWNYKIAMMAPEGSVVQKGDPVLMFDATELEHQLHVKVAERDSAAATLELTHASARVARQDERLAISEAQAELRKAKVKTAPAHIVGNIESEKSRHDLELAAAKVAYLERKARATAERDQAEINRWRNKRDRAEGRVAEMRAAIGQMTVVAPRSGTLIYATNWEGEKKKLGDTAWRAETVLQIASLDAMAGDGEIDEVDIAKVALDRPVSLRLDAQADVEVHGRIRKIAQTVQRAAPDNPLKVVHIEIELPGEHDVRLRPGMRFRGEIQIERIEDVLQIPLDAVVPTPEGPMVRRRRGTVVDVVPITLGPRNEHSVVVTAGLDEGDELLRIHEVPR